MGVDGSVSVREGRELLLLVVVCASSANSSRMSVVR